LNERLRMREWAERELELARSLQTRLLPPQEFAAPGVNVAARNLAAHTVAGDLYDVIRLDDGSLFIAVADVAGKGVGASMIMASVKSALPYVAREGVAAAAAALNAKLCAELGRREFVALVCGTYDPATGVAQVVNAGCPDAYLVHGRTVIPIVNPGERLPLGIRPNVAYQPVSVTLAHGDRLLFVSDGMPEAPVGGEPLGYERFAEIVAGLPAAPAAAWADSLVAAVTNVADRGPQVEGLSDDWTAVVLERTS
jgi:sigma-B regulation protein RsbU (phosphoserine phosphatase)